MLLNLLLLEIPIFLVEPVGVAWPINPSVLALTDILLPETKGVPLIKPPPAAFEVIVTSPVNDVVDEDVEELVAVKLVTADDVLTWVPWASVSQDEVLLWSWLPISYISDSVWPWEPVDILW